MCTESSTRARSSRRKQARLSTAAAAATLTLAGLLLSGCGSSRPSLPTGSVSASLPTRSQASPGLTSTRTPEATSATSATSRPAATPTETTPTETTPTQTAVVTQTATETQTATATTTQTATATQTATRTPTVAVSPTPSAAPSQPAATASQSKLTPLWVWLLIAAAVLAIAAAAAVLLRRRSRMQAWQARFDTSKGEVAWLARDLIPKLALAPTAQQIAGGWRISADRAMATEDRLTALEADAPDDAHRGRARTLRDAVRTSRSRLDAIPATLDNAVALDQLRLATADLELALASVDQPAQQAGGPQSAQR